MVIVAGAHAAGQESPSLASLDVKKLNNNKGVKMFSTKTSRDVGMVPLIN